MRATSAAYIIQRYPSMVDLPVPARVAYQVAKLPMGVKVEIETTAVKLGLFGFLKPSGYKTQICLS